jgi:hypothetical protein
LFLINFSLSKDKKYNIFLFPGLGADKRIFNGYNFGDNNVYYINWVSSGGCNTLHEYSQKLLSQISAKENLVFIGVSFGGMCAVEIAKNLKPEKLILISSAKNSKEIPRYFRCLKYFPLYRIIPEWFYINGSILIKYVFGKMGKADTSLLVKMLRGNPPGYVKSAVRYIIEWNNTGTQENLTHIHGKKDNVLPFKLIKYPIVIDEGNHFMILNKKAEIEKIIIKLLL